MNIFKYIFIGSISIIKFTILFIKSFFIGLITIMSIFPYYIIKGLKFIFSKKDTNNNHQIEKKFIPITITSLSVITYLICVFILTRWYVQNERSKNFTSDFSNNMITNNEFLIEDTNNIYNDSTAITPPPTVTTDNEPPKNTNQNTTSQSVPTKANTNFINVNLNYYIQKNSETVAWLQVNGTKVNYPVVQNKDNNFYLEHDFYKRKTKNGWIFADYRDDFTKFKNNTIIYGHNLINDTMFGTIPNLLKKNWYSNKNNHYIKLSTKTTNSIWQIFSVYKIEPTTDYLQTSFNSAITYQEFLYKLKNRSVHKFNVDLNYTDKIITLSTCDDTGTKRVAIHAKLINIENK